MRRAPLLAGLVCVTISALFAQDPAKMDRKHSKVEFEDAYIRILRWSIGPHEKVPMHEHPPSVSLALTDGQLRFTQADGGTTEARRKAGQISRGLAGKQAVENLGDAPFEALQIELKGKLAEERAKMAISVAGQRAKLQQLLKQFLAREETSEGGGRGAQPPNGTPPDPCFDAKPGQYKVGWGPDGSCGVGLDGDSLTDCMSDGVMNCASDAGCLQNACQHCGGTWQANPGGNSASCFAPADGFPCCD